MSTPAPLEALDTHSSVRGAGSPRMGSVKALGASRAWLLAGLAATAASVVMLGAVRGPFIFDDVPLILGNHHVHGLEHWREWFLHSMWNNNFDVADGQHRSFWRPIVVASYAFDWWWGGGSPIAFHVTNLVIHALNAALAFHLLSGWVKDRSAPFAGALLFAVHPLPAG